MIYHGNRNNNVSVKTSTGLSERVQIKNIVTQGGPLGGALCSVTVDKIGKEALEANKDIEENSNINDEIRNNEEYIYRYLNVKIPPLSMVDDLLTIQLGKMSHVSYMSKYET